MSAGPYTEMLAKAMNVPRWIAPVDTCFDTLFTTGPVSKKISVRCIDTVGLLAWARSRRRSVSLW